MSKRARGFTLIEICIVVLVLGIIAAITLPNYLAARTNTQIKTCLSNMRRISDAKDLWAADTRAAPTATPTQEQLMGTAETGYLQNWPNCPENGSYVIGNITTNPTCTVGTHVLP